MGLPVFLHLMSITHLLILLLSPLVSSTQPPETITILCSGDYAKKFNEIATEYFFRNFGQGGLAYLKWLNSSQSPGECFQVLAGLEKTAIDRFYNEVRRIIDVFKSPKSFWRTTKDIGDVRYRLHRFLGLLDLMYSVAVSSNQSSLIKPENLDYIKSMSSKERHGMDNFLRSFKKEVNKRPEMSPELIGDALAIIGRLCWSQEVGMPPKAYPVVSFVTRAIGNFDPQCASSQSIRCRFIPGLFKRVLNAGENFITSVSDAIERFDYLFYETSSSGVSELGSKLLYLSQMMLEKCSPDSDSSNKFNKGVDLLFSQVLNQKIATLSTQVGVFACQSCQETNAMCSTKLVGGLMEAGLCGFFNRENTGNCEFVAGPKLDSAVSVEGSRD